MRYSKWACKIPIVSFMLELQVFLHKVSIPGILHIDGKCRHIFFSKLKFSLFKIIRNKTKFTKHLEAKGTQNNKYLKSHYIHNHLKNNY